jgi:ISXO2-like transposase domain/Transposase zinc-ribbon domain
VSARPHSDGITRAHPPVGAWRRRQKKSHLLQASYRTTDLFALIGEGQRGALDYLIKSRWGAAGDNSQVCPECGTIGTHYWLESRQYWKCRERSCRAQFSIVSGTYLHSTKMPADRLLSVLFHFVEGKNSISARQISGLHDLSHQAAHVFLMKVRDAIRDSMLREPPLTGKIQADAAYFIKYKRPRNVGTGPAFADKEDEKNAGLNENAKTTRFVHPNMHALVVFVQGGAESTTRRYKLARVKTEGQVNIAELGKKFCTGELEFTTDEHSGYSLLVGPTVQHYVILHQKQFQDADKRNTNNAESFFSRMRHAYRGAWHRTSIQNLEWYGWEFAWRQTMVGRSNEKQLQDLLARVLAPFDERRFSDYWRKQPDRPKPDPDDVGLVVEIDKRTIPKKRGRPLKGEVRYKEPPRKKRKYNKKTAASKDPAPPTDTATD